MGFLTALTVVLFIILFSLFFIPVDLKLHLSLGESPRFRMRFGWLFGLIWKEVRNGEKRPKKARVEEFRGGRTILGILRTEGFIKNLLVLLKEIITSLKIAGLRTRLRVGLADPADTGLLLALIWPSFLYLKSRFPIEERIEPSFDEEVLEGYMEGVIRLWPFKLIVPFLRFALSLPTLRAIKTLMVMRWK